MYTALALAVFVPQGASNPGEEHGCASRHQRQGTDWLESTEQGSHLGSQTLVLLPG